MYPRSFIILAVTATALLVTACEESSSPDLTENRYVYYAVDGTSGGEAGFYRYDIESGARTKMDNKGSDYATRVADNGIVLFDVPNSAHRYYGVCEDGTIMPVPLPETNDPSYEFEYSVPPRIWLAGNGHHAVYAIDRVPSGPQQGERKTYLAYFDCAQWKMSLINADSLIRAHAGYTYSTRGVLIGDYVLSNPTGTAVWFAGGAVTDMPVQDTLGYLVLEWTKDGTNVRRSLKGTPYELKGYNHRGPTLIYSTDGVVHGYLLEKGWKPVHENVPPESVHPWQVARGIDVGVRWENDAVHITKASSGASVFRILEIKDIEQTFGTQYEFDERCRIGISPDGYWIVLTLTREDQSSTCDLLALRDNGTQVTRLGEGVPHGFPVISPAIIK